MLRTKEERRQAALEKAQERLRDALVRKREETVKIKPGASLEYYAEQNQRKLMAGNAVLEWLDFSTAEKFEPDDYEDPQHLIARMAYCSGFNDCRAALLKRVANLVLTDDDTNAGDCECTEDDECDKCEQ